MRIRLVIFCLLLTLALPAISQAQDLPLSEAMQHVFDEAQWDGYEVVAQAGYGGNEGFAAQQAFILKKGDHNVLCIVESQPGTTDFQISIQTDKAIYQGDLLPSLLIDTGGDALFYTYHHDDGSIASEMFGSIKQEGIWSVPTLFLYHNADENGLYPEIQVFMDDGQIYRDSIWCDENGNIVKQGERECIADELLATSLGDFNIAGFNAFMAEW